MYVQSLDRVVPGSIAAKAVVGEHGEILVTAGTALSAAYLAALRRRDISVVYLTDGLADDVQPVQPISERLRARVVANVADMFTRVKQTAALTSAGGSDRPRSVAHAARRLDSGQAPLSGEAIDRLYGDVEALIAELADTPVIESLSTLRSHHAYTYQHSVDVAVMGIVIGQRAGLPRDQLADLALGCLLHDIGKTYIDEAILDKPSRLTHAEYLEVRKHPAMGFELLRRLPLRTILPAHVAHQHHEHQDGSGYPQGLAGSNRIARTSGERFDPRRMLLIAEIAAVADVYSAITSHRPYRLAMPIDQAAGVLRGMSGRHLNRDGVRLLLATVPVYWVGHWVDVLAGPYVGWRGIVTAVSRHAMDRPRLRLLLDPDRELVADPVELDLRHDEHTVIASIPAGAHPAS